MIGRELVRACHEVGYAVHYLSTSKSKLKEEKSYKGFYWDPASGEIDTACFEGVTKIINLAGAPVAKRWTSSYKQEIMDSRIESTELLYNKVKELDLSIDHIVSASAIGIYPPSLTNFYEEEPTPEPVDFMSEVVSKWEKAASKFKDLGTQVTYVRIGLVLSKNGGVLEKLSTPIKYFVGSGLGTGHQWQSWIHIDDLVGIFMYCLKHNITGPVNAVAPNTVTNNALVKGIARTLSRPLILPNVPAGFLKLVLGEMHVIITRGQRVSSKKIENLGYQFMYNHLESALDDLLYS